MQLHLGGNGIAGGPALDQRSPMWPFAALPLAVLIIGSAGVPAGAGGSLYSRLGGLSQIEIIVDETINQVAADPRTRPAIAGDRLPAFKQSVAAQMCALSGGPCKQDAASARKAAADLKISDGQFEVFVGSMRAVLDRRVAEREKNELLRLLAPMKREVVGS